MERYSKEHSSKFQNRYSEEFKTFICKEFLTGILKRRQIEDKYNIGHGSLTTWLKDKNYDYSKPSIVPLPLMANQPDRSSKDNKKTFSELEHELQQARLLAETYRKMIEIAENEFKIKIVKKSNTK